jgi:hypothetical protein
VDRLRALADRKAVDADGRPLRPRLRFVVEPGGQEAFWKARRQTSFLERDWPATLQFSERVGARGLLSGKEVGR